MPRPFSGRGTQRLERDGEEVARATSVVRYRPGSQSLRHEHALGEEFLVMEETFANGGEPLRNPSVHAPWSEEGCVLFVKLRQFHP